MGSTQQKVLACVDGSQSATSVVDYATWIAAAVDVPLQLLHTIDQAKTPAVADLSGSIGLGAQRELLDELTQVEAQRAKLLMRQGKMILDAAKERVESKSAVQVSWRQRHGSLAENLIDLEDETRVLVLGIRGESHADGQGGVGHKIESVLRSLHRPMLVVNQPFQEPKSILLAYDGSEAADKALQMVVSSPLLKSLHCHVVFAGSEEASIRPLEKAKNTLEAASVAMTSHRVSDDIAASIGRLQSEYKVDLTVMGAFSHGRLRDFLWGSVTAKVLENTAKPLLLLR
ncbi:universal stress protein [uncultured Umboniibacter sp.]|uniref:universal stress protein n=1 Tax=uncultured Umboniibacter sp. TaxID=1798917 RepID=UPI00261D7556|nr:universal stress protein [uncultured Umboniibacter sp.]